MEELRASADGGWDLVDFAYQRRLPATTEQILHPEKYLDDEGALPVPDVPDPPDGWEKADGGTVGEFFTREILRQDAEDVGADEAAAGWGGDRYVFFRSEGAPAECADDCREENALAIVWRGDDPAEAAELRTAIQDYRRALARRNARGRGNMGARRRLGGRRRRGRRRHPCARPDRPHRAPTVAPAGPTE